MNFYVNVLKKYTVFDGRAARSEFWYFTLFNVIISFVLGILDSIIGTSSGGIGVLGGLYGLGVLLPSLAVGSRRLHDTDRSGWMQLLVLIPFVGAIILIVFFTQDSKPGANQHGPNPKGM